MPAHVTPFIAHCLELLGCLGTARSCRMFGGHGLYIDELFVALVAEDVLYLKVDAQTRKRFEDAGCAPFVYTAKGRPITMSYWRVPDEALDSPALMQPWARLALDAALRSRAATKRIKPRRAGSTTRR